MKFLNYLLIGIGGILLIVGIFFRFDRTPGSNAPAPAADSSGVENHEPVTK